MMVSEVSVRSAAYQKPSSDVGCALLARTSMRRQAAGTDSSNATHKRLVNCWCCVRHLTASLTSAIRTHSLPTVDLVYDERYRRL